MPSYNEGPRIGKVIKSIPKTITVAGKKFATEVVSIDDGSADDTADQALKAGATVLSHVINSGAGAATRTGLRYALNRIHHGEDVAFAISIDADGQHTADDIERLVRHALKNDSDLIVGNRLHEGNKEDMPFHRVFGNVGLSLVSRMLFGVKLKDTQSGLRLFSRRALPVVAGYTIDRYGFCTEMLWLAERAKLKVEEIPIAVKYFEATLAKGQNNWGAVLLIKDLLWVRFNS